MQAMTKQLNKNYAALEAAGTKGKAKKLNGKFLLS